MTIQQWLEQNVVKSFQEYEERMRDGEFVDDAELVEEVRKLFLSQTKEEVKEVSVTEVSEEMPNGQYRKDVSNSKLRSIIKDFKFTSLEDGIKKTYFTND
jgi:nucleoside-diphosphate-sugar epimerase